MHKNWEGHEDMRQMMLAAPKFGNDDDYVDLVAKDLQEKTTEVIESFKDYYGVTWTPNGSNSQAIFGFSWDCEATPDGRFKGDMLADGTVSPMLGADKKGPLAVLRSIGKIDVVKTYSHLLNQKLSPDLIEGEVGREAFYSYIKTWMDLGISHVQFNIHKKDTLIDAQVHPDKYQDLVVRVAGFSVYYIDLSKGMQDGIIGRTEQSGW
jgi:formate C-acetyltransferase